MGSLGHQLAVAPQQATQATLPASSLSWLLANQNQPTGANALSGGLGGDIGLLGRRQLLSHLGSFSSSEAFARRRSAASGLAMGTTNFSSGDLLQSLRRLQAPNSQFSSLLSDELLRRLLVRQATEERRPPPLAVPSNVASVQREQSSQPAPTASLSASQGLPPAQTDRGSPPSLSATAPVASSKGEDAIKQNKINDFSLSGRSPVVLYTTLDDYRLTPYQGLARKQIEYFEATQAEVEAGAQGRNKAIVLGQVGIRCRHCRYLPRSEKAAASAFYPSKLGGLYQAAQNVANSHIAKDCNKVPKAVRDELLSLGNRKSAPGGGRAYWSEEAEKAGIFEDGENGLRFLPRQRGNKKGRTN